MNEEYIKKIKEIIESDYLTDIDYIFNVLENYPTLINIFYHLIETKSTYLNNYNAKILLDKILKEIWKKLDNKEQLTELEGKIFLYTLYNETCAKLQIDPSEIETHFFETLREHHNGSHLLDANGNEKIYYYKNVLSIICQKGVSLSEKVRYMTTICHELVHAKQIRLNGNNINFGCFISSLDSIIYKYIGNDYYKNNYIYVGCEVDANIRGIVYLIDFLNDHLLTFPGEKNQEETLAEYEQRLNTKSLKHLVSEGGFSELNGRYVLRTCSDILEKHSNLLNNYPILNLMYKKDGSLRSIMNLLMNRKSKNFLMKFSNLETDLEEVDKIYTFIIIHSFYGFDEVIDNPDLVNSEILKISEVISYLEFNLFDEFEKKILEECNLYLNRLNEVKKLNKRRTRRA